MSAIRKAVRLKFILIVDFMMLMFLLWSGAASRRECVFKERCSGVALPLQFVSGLSEESFISLLDAHGCKIDEKRELLGPPCCVTLYRCSSYCFNGHNYLVEFEFLRGRLMTVAVKDKDDQSVGVRSKNERKLKRRRIGNMVRYSDADMLEDVDRFWQYCL